MRRKNLLKWFGMFFAVMLLLTVLSRASDSINVARVQVSTLQNQLIVHQVSGTGKVQGTRETAVFAPADQRVSRILVQEGQSVKKDELMFTLSLDMLALRMREKEAEIQEKEWEIQELSSKAQLDEEKKETEEKRAQENYERAVSDGEINVANARMEANVAREKLDIYFASVNYDPSRRDTSREQSLRDEIRARDEALNQTIMNRDQEVTEAERALEDAKRSSVQDNSLKKADSEREALKLELSALQNLEKNGGEIVAPCGGVVKSVSISTGNQTGQEAAIILYETEGDLRMTGTIRREDLQYAAVGDAVELKGSSGTTVDDAVVETIHEDEENPAERVITVAVPQGTLAIGESVEFTISRKSGPYRTCIPLTGLYEENGVTYVYVTETKNSILGEVLTARKTEVTVIDKNEKTAALGEGSLSSDQKVITGSSRMLEDGSRVRLEES